MKRLGDRTHEVLRGTRVIWPSSLLSLSPFARYLSLFSGVSRLAMLSLAVPFIQSHSAFHMLLLELEGGERERARQRWRGKVIQGEKSAHDSSLFCVYSPGVNLEARDCLVWRVLQTVRVARDQTERGKRLRITVTSLSLSPRYVYSFCTLSRPLAPIHLQHPLWWSDIGLEGGEWRESEESSRRSDATQSSIRMLHIDSYHLLLTPLRLSLPPIALPSLCCVLWAKVARAEP